ncbi:hypothetical protein ANCCAN_09056 [Ancylostoma caninum]|uniref:Uncharacterized protein n=1 Tax=Ancylostoma caninum TaxID=29170 RepID=A0A368GKQ3_ANCCA|nr:hypothetical protein ANCCAN_09056 [Ancylostoma caninum]
MVVTQQQLSNSLKTASNNMSRMRLLRLPENARLTAANLRNDWIIEEEKPFVRTNLKKLMTKWRRSHCSTPDDFSTHCTDFVRRYLIQACDPPAEIQKYSHRISGKGARKEDLKDLPDSVADALIGCLLEALGLGQPEMEKSSEELKENPTE